MLSKVIPKARFTRLHFAAVLVLLAALGFSGIYWWRLDAAQDNLREQTLVRIAQNARLLATAVAGQTETTVNLADFALHHLRDDYRDDDQIAFAATVETILKTFSAGAVLQIGVIDAEGYLAYSNLGMRERIFLGDRAHFKAHVGATTDRLFISKPIFGRVSKTWSIQLTRPILRRGKFAGVVVLSLAPEYISANLAIQGLGDEDVIALFDTEGAYLSRSRDLNNALGKSVPPERPFVGADVPAHGTFRTVAAYDSVPRTFAWRRIDEHPLTVVVGIGEAAILDPIETTIRNERQRNALGILTVLLMAVGIAALLVRVSTRQRALAESEKRYRGFFDTNTAIKLLIDPADGRIVDVNPAAVEYYGHTREALLSMRIGDINCLPPEEVKAEMARAKSEQRLYFRFLHRLASGEVRQVEVYSGPVETHGRTLLFSVIHDITARVELENRLRESEELHRTLFKTMAEGVLVVDPDGAILAWNDAALDILDVDVAGLLDRRARVTDADGRPLAAEEYPSIRAARGEELEHLLFGIVHRDNSQHWVTASSRSFCREGEPHPCSAVLSFSEITRLIEAEESQKLAQSVFDAAGEGILVTDVHNRIVAVNPAFTAITGYASAEVVGKTPKLLASGQHDASFYESMWQRLRSDGHWEGEIVNRRKDGKDYVEWLKISTVRDHLGQPRRYVALFSDVTNKKRQEELVWHQANYDSLTALPNRQLLEDRLGRAIAQAHRSHSQVALLFIDLDRFKPVNDTYGHAVGDELLRQVGRRLENMLRDEDTVARLGGDEFVVVLPDLRVAGAPERAAEKIVAVLSEPFRVDTHIVEISCCVGIALFPRDADSATALIERADDAMYAAKEAGRATWKRA